MSLSNEEEKNICEENKTVKKVKTTNYFDVREEDAVKRYIIAETKEEKEKIYNEFLRMP